MFNSRLRNQCQCTICVGSLTLPWYEIFIQFLVADDKSCFLSDGGDLWIFTLSRDYHTRGRILRDAWYNNFSIQ